MATLEELAEIQTVSPGATEMREAGQVYIHLPTLALPEGCEPNRLEALLCLSSHSGYSTRLFLSQPIPARGKNWTSHCIFAKGWHTWSWNNVPANIPPIEILVEHLRGLQ
jgi:hypothetical protein